MTTPPPLRDDDEDDAPLTSEIRLRVNGMTCQQNCAATVERALLSSVPGAVDAAASFADGSAVVRVRGDVARARTAATMAVEDVGFECLVEDDDYEKEGEEEEEEEETDDVGELTSQRPSSRWTSDEATTTTRTITSRGGDSRTITSRDTTVVATNVAPRAFHDEEEEEVAVVTLQLSGITCASCVGRVERALRSVRGVQTASVNLVTSRARATFDLASANHGDYDTFPPDLRALARRCAAAAREAGYGAEVIAAGGARRTDPRESAKRARRARERERDEWAEDLEFAAILTIPIVLIHLTVVAGFGVGATEDDHRHFHPVLTRHAPGGSHADLFSQFAMLFLATPVQFGVGRRFYDAAWAAWRRDGSTGMDALVALGTTAAYAYSVVALCVLAYAEGHDSANPRRQHHRLPETTFETGAMLLTFVTFGKWLESHAAGRTADALEALVELQPDRARRVVREDARRLREDDTVDFAAVPLHSLRTEDVDVSVLRVGDLLVVRPGARVPADGVVVALDGRSACRVDESALTGESLPASRGVGDALRGSTVLSADSNDDAGSVLLRATAVGADTALARVAALVEEAWADRAPSQALADELASYFVPTVMGLSAATLVGWWLVAGTPLFPAVLRAVAVVVVACPCALGLATPTAVVVGTGVGARYGLLIKGGSVLERAAEVDAVVFDKTGTLTTGRTTLGEYAEHADTAKARSVLAELRERRPDAVPADRIGLWLAACAETASDHPLSTAIRNAAEEKWGEDVVRAEDGVAVFEARIVPGQGVSCTVAKKTGWGGRYYKVRVGRRSFATDNKDDSNSNEEDSEARRARERGRVVVFVGVASCDAEGAAFPPPSFVLLASLSVVDPLKPTAARAVAALLRARVDVHLCTGDHVGTARAVAAELGIPLDRVVADVAPEGKAALVDRLRTAGRTVAVVGDGVNDAVALARADVGVALGAGAEVAIAAADVVLTRDDPVDAVAAIDLSRAVVRRVRWNLAWALAYNVTALPLAAGALRPLGVRWTPPPALAGLMMALSSLSVVLNSLLLRGYVPPDVDEEGRLVRGGGRCGTRKGGGGWCCGWWRGTGIGSAGEQRVHEGKEYVAV